ncbi:MAG: amidophosphoribosyltransferase, partial [Planctomycetota bacterium]
TLIDHEASFADGLRNAQEAVEGSCSILLLTDEGIYAARDRLGRTPVTIGTKPGAVAAAMETCAFPNLGLEVERALGPGEIVRLTADGVEQLHAPGDRMQICTFLWVYYGYPASDYEGINVEACRNRCGAALARAENVEVDMVAGVPDSGTAHAVGYAHEARIPYRRPFVKYTPTWPRSFMPQDQRIRDIVARMKLIPVRELIQGQRMLFCEDSIVRGTQLKDTIQRLYDYGAKEGAGGDRRQGPGGLLQRRLREARGHGGADQQAAEPDLPAVPAAGGPGRGGRAAQGEALHLLLGRRGVSVHVAAAGLSPTSRPRMPS